MSQFCISARLLAVAVSLPWVGSMYAQQQTPPAMYVTDVVNAANRIPRGFPGNGVAQGSIFAITGKALGPTDRLLADPPAEPAGSLGGVSVVIKAGGAEVGIPLLFVSATEIAAVMPADIATGDAVLSVDNNGAKAEAPVKILERGFGIFNLGYFAGPTWAIAMRPDADPPYTDFVHPVHAGDHVRLIGTGLGVAASMDFKVFVGTKLAEVVSAAPTFCCDGLLEGLFPLASGTAGIDGIEIVVPDGVPGCTMNVTVQMGSQVSNSAYLSIAEADSDTCRHVNNIGDGEVVTVGDQATVGNINMLQIVNRAVTGTQITEIGSESATAQFIRFKTGADSYDLRSSQYGYLADHPEPGSCISLSYRTDPAKPPVAPPGTTPPPPADPTVFLDAGARLVFKNEANRSFAIPKSRDGKTYGGGLGSSFSIPPLPPTDNLFVKPDKITVTNESGGPDIPAFTVPLNLPRPEFKWENIDAVATIPRTAPLTVNWSGGDQNGFVSILGSSLSMDGAATLTGIFTCVEKVSAGSFTIPLFALQQVPPSGLVGGASISTLTLQTYVAKKVDVPNTDVTIFSAGRMLIRGTMYGK